MRQTGVSAALTNHRSDRLNKSIVSITKEPLNQGGTSDKIE
jgi:hypothetical protein